MGVCGVWWTFYSGDLLTFTTVTDTEEDLTEAIELFRDLGQYPRVLSCLHNLAILQMESGNFEAAPALFDKAYQANDAQGSHTSTFALGTTHNVIHILRGEYDRAFEALLPAFEFDETQILSGLWTDIYQQLALCYYTLGAYDLAFEYSQKAISHHHSTTSTGRAPAFAILALLQIRRGNQ